MTNIVLLILFGGVTAVGYLFFKVLPAVGGISGLKRAYHAFFSSMRLKEDSVLTATQLQKLAVGTAYAEQQNAYLNALETGLGKNHITKITSEWWGIDSPEEAAAALDRLRDEGFRSYLPAVLEAGAVAEEHLEEHFLRRLGGGESDDAERAYGQFMHLRESLPMLIENEVLTGPDDVARVGVTGWDAGRLVFLARLCHESAYIDEATAWRYIDAAYTLAADSFADWESFAMSYVLGRSMWGGEDCANDGMVEIVRDLLKHEKSPWVTTTLK